MFTAARAYVVLLNIATGSFTKGLWQWWPVCCAGVLSTK